MGWAKTQTVYEPALRGQSHWSTRQQSFIQGVTEQMHKHSWHSFYAPEGLYYLIHPVIRPLAISCVCKVPLLQFPSELNLLLNLPQWYPVVSTPGYIDIQSSQPLFWSIRYPHFFCIKWLFCPRSFSPS